MRTFTTLLLVAVVLLAACSDDEPVTAGDRVDDSTTTPSGGDAGGDDDGNTIEGDYIATEVEDHGEPRALVEGTTIRLRLGDGQLSASAGCNTMGGAYAIEDDVLHVQALSMTEIGCDPPRHDQDQWMADVLSATPAMDPVEEGFVLRTDNAAITFVDRSIVEPDAALVGTTWEVSGFIEGTGPDGSASSGTGDQGRVILEENGFVTGHDGCNSFGYAGAQGEEPTDGLRYEVDGDRITFSGAAATTDIACPEVDTDRFWAVLTGTVTWEIDSDRLTLRSDAGPGVTFEAQA